MLTMQKLERKKTRPMSSCACAYEIEEDAPMPMERHCAEAAVARGRNGSIPAR